MHRWIFRVEGVVKGGRSHVLQQRSLAEGVGSRSHHGSFSQVPLR